MLFVKWIPHTHSQKNWNCHGHGPSMKLKVSQEAINTVLMIPSTRYTLDL